MNSKVFIACFLLASVAQARTFTQAKNWHRYYDRNRAEVGFDHILDGSTSGQAAFGSITHKFKNDHWLGLKFSNQTHVYDDGTKLSDGFFELNHSKKLSKSTYIESRVGTSFDAKFSPVFLLETIPHYSAYSQDFGLGLRFSEYKGDVRTWTLLPSYAYFFKTFSVGVNGYGVLVDSQTLWAGAIWFNKDWTNRFSTKFWLSGGKTVEGPNVYVPFTSQEIQPRYYLTPSVILKGSISNYDSSIRREVRLGLGVEWTF